MGEEGPCHARTVKPRHKVSDQMSKALTCMCAYMCRLGGGGGGRKEVYMCVCVCVGSYVDADYPSN